MLLRTSVYKFLCGHLLFRLQGLHLGMELLGQMVTLLSDALSNSRTECQSSCIFSIPPVMRKGSNFFTSTPTLISICLSDYSLPSGHTLYSTPKQLVIIRCFSSSRRTVQTGCTPRRKHRSSTGSHDILRNFSTLKNIFLLERS